MSAPVGNQFWKLRSKHGRDKIFESPETLWEAACEYFEACEENTLTEVDFRGKDATEVELPKMRAFTWAGLETFLDMSSEGLRNYKVKPEYQDFVGVITRIERVMWEQKFTGAAAGLLNPNIIARDLGLKEVSDVNLNDQRKATAEVFPDDLDQKPE
jgi:DNA-packaging protein gp3